MTSDQDLSRKANELLDRLREPGGVSAIERALTLISLVVGAAFLLIGAWSVHHFHLDEFIFPRATAQATVVENRYRPTSSSRNAGLGGNSYYAIMRFTAQDGREVTLQDWISFERPSFGVGQTVTVFYDPEEPQHAMVDRGWKNLVPPGVPGLFGFLMVLGGLQRLRKARAAGP